MLTSLIAAAICFVCNVCAANYLSGFWQHPKDPVWPDVIESLGTGIASRNNDDPSSVGFAVLKEVVAGPKQWQWSGQVYLPRLGDYKRVILTLPDTNTLIIKVTIGFIRSSLKWTRVAFVPDL